jgi:Tfp pilus assembly protein PilF
MSTVAARRTLHPLLAGLLAAVCLALAGCATRPPPLPADRLLRDHLVAAPSQPVQTDQVFAVSEAMRAFMDQQIVARSSGRVRDVRQLLIDALYKPGQLQLDYDSSSTRNAAQAFEARTGNCLSLVIMTAAMARHLGVPVTFQNVVIDQAYQRVGSLVMVSGHVNLVLGRTLPPNSVMQRADSVAMLVDFLPASEVVGARTQRIEEHTVLAMFMNNRAAEVLAEGRATDAYWFAREAVRADPTFIAGINTLGVVYRRLGLLQPAEEALRQVLEAQPDNAATLGNLVGVLQAAGRTDEARPLAERLVALQPHAPFHFFDLGRQALVEGRLEDARGLFERELSRLPHQPMVLAFLAQTHQRLGRSDRAARALAEAIEYSISIEQRGIYSAKLAALRAAGARL